MVAWLDPHIHMISRTTDDYQRMAYAGCAAVSEPAFWAGFDRGTAAGLPRLLPPPHRSRAEAGRPVPHPALLLAVHQRQGSGERHAVARGDRA